MGALIQLQWIRFIIVGSANTVFGFIAYSAFIICSAPAYVGIVGGSIASIAFSFFFQGKYVFEDLSASRIPRFVLCYLAIIGANIAALDWLSAMVSDKLVAQAMLTPLVVVSSYLMLTRLVFTDRLVKANVEATAKGSPANLVHESRTG